MRLPREHEHAPRERAASPLSTADPRPVSPVHAVPISYHDDSLGKLQASRLINVLVGLINFLY